MQVQILSSAPINITDTFLGKYACELFNSPRLKKSLISPARKLRVVYNSFAMSIERPEKIIETFDINAFHQIVEYSNCFFNMGLKNEGPNLPQVYIDFDNSFYLKELFDQILRSLKEDSNEKEIVEKVIKAVSDHFVYRIEKEVDNLVKRDGKEYVSLDEFVEKRAGTCFQTTLTVCIFLEKLYQLDLIKKRPLLGHFDGDRFSHCWCQINIDGIEYIIDVVHDFFGTQEEHDKKVIIDLAESAFY